MFVYLLDFKIIDFEQWIVKLSITQILITTNSNPFVIVDIKILSFHYLIGILSIDL
jgi:hypothetical protein